MRGDLLIRLLLDDRSDERELHHAIRIRDRLRVRQSPNVLLIVERERARLVHDRLGLRKGDAPREAGVFELQQPQQILGRDGAAPCYAPRVRDERAAGEDWDDGRVVRGRRDDERVLAGSAVGEQRAERITGERDRGRSVALEQQLGDDCRGQVASGRLDALP